MLHVPFCTWRTHAFSNSHTHHQHDQTAKSTLAAVQSSFWQMMRGFFCTLHKRSTVSVTNHYKDAACVCVTTYNYNWRRCVSVEVCGAGSFKFQTTQESEVPSKNKRNKIDFLFNFFFDKMRCIGTFDFDFVWGCGKSSARRQGDLPLCRPRGCVELRRRAEDVQSERNETSCL